MGKRTSPTVASLLPDPATRTWVHPSELPNFDSLVTLDGVTARSNNRYAVVLFALALLLGGIVAIHSHQGLHVLPRASATSHHLQVDNDRPGDIRKVG